LQEFDEIYKVTETYDVEGDPYDTLVVDLAELENSTIYS
jgi:hypothetical protein